LIGRKKTKELKKCLLRAAHFFILFPLFRLIHHVIANQELMPLRLNISKKDQMGERQAALMVKLREAGWRW